MVGLTYTEFKPQDFCYIVVYTPIPSHEDVVEFLEGNVTEVSHNSQKIPPEHPIWRYLHTPPKKVESIRAVVTDPHPIIRHPSDPIKQGQEPGRNYLVVPPLEYFRYLHSHGRTEEALGHVYRFLDRTQHTLERTQKMNLVQQQRISQLEVALEHQRRK
ncbi:MAG: hypothetical protein Q8R47_02020 [Nanoarchaeota archaeon]|nr:hypothetical protein [Nanoarchaeota archaeon]